MIVSALGPNFNRFIKYCFMSNVNKITDRESPIVLNIRFNETDDTITQRRIKNNTNFK